MKKRAKREAKSPKESKPRANCLLKCKLKMKTHSPRVRRTKNLWSRIEMVASKVVKIRKEKGSDPTEKTLI